MFRLILFIIHCFLHSIYYLYTFIKSTKSVLHKLRYYVSMMLIYQDQIYCLLKVMLYWAPTILPLVSAAYD